jgi:hypothetical protein
LGSGKRARRKAEETIEPAAAAALVEDLGGTRHRLDTLWRERPVVLVFLRHFG